MDWATQIDNYCERVDFSFWSEPVNAATNVAFLIAALMAWRVVRDRDDWGVRALIVILAAIGIGSFLFHTFATRWSSVADVFPIMAFILLNIWLATVRMLGTPVWGGFLALALFFPFYAAVTFIVVTLTGGLNGSEGYVPSVLIMAGYGLWLKPDKPEAGRGLLTAAGLLAVSLVARTADQSMCSAMPIGSHWVWHVVNAIVMYWLIVVLYRHDRHYPID